MRLVRLVRVSSAFPSILVDSGKGNVGNLKCCGAVRPGGSRGPGPGPGPGGISDLQGSRDLSSV